AAPGLRGAAAGAADGERRRGCARRAHRAPAEGTGRSLRAGAGRVQGRRRRDPGGQAVSMRRQRGQSLVEYLIVLPSLLLLVLGAGRFALLDQIKSRVTYAAVAAARQGALTGASSNAMKDAFAAGLTPLFTPKPDIGGLLRGRAVAAIEAYNPLVTSIKRISPPTTINDD